MSDFLNKLRQEITETQKRRQKLDLLKIGFVTALLGFGSVKFQDIASFYHVLYIVPLVAVFFDMLIMGEHFSIKRLGAFLRLESHDDIEKKYEKFVAKNRDKYFKYGSRGFSVLSIIAAFYLLIVCQGNAMIRDYVWFLGIFISYVIVIILGVRQHKKLDELENIEQL